MTRDVQLFKGVDRVVRVYLQDERDLNENLTGATSMTVIAVDDEANGSSRLEITSTTKGTDTDGVYFEFDVTSTLTADLKVTQHVAQGTVLFSSGDQFVTDRFYVEVLQPVE